MNRFVLFGSLIAAFALSGAVAQPNSLGAAEFYWLMDRACVHGDELSVKMLLEAGADPTGPSDYEAFLKTYNLPFEPSWHLCQAAYGGHVSVVRLLLDAGADPDVAEGEGVTPITIASELGHFDIVKLLLDAGANAQYRTPSGTAEEIAVAKGHEDIAELIRARERSD